MLERTVRGHGRGLIEGYVARVNSDVLVTVDIVRNLFCLGLKVSPVGSAIGVELRMGEVHYLFTPELVFGLVAFGKFQGIERGLVTSRVPEIVGMNVQGVRKSEVFICLDQSGDNFSGSDIEGTGPGRSRKDSSVPMPMLLFRRG